MGRRFRRKSEERAIARRRISRLFELAHHRMLEDEPDLADRAVALARRIAMRYQTGLKTHERDLLCRQCGGYLFPGRNARIRVHGGMKRVNCLRCGHTSRRPYRAEQRARRSLRRDARKQNAEPPRTDEAPLPSQGERG